MNDNSPGQSPLERPVRPRAWFCEVDVYPSGTADYLRSAPSDPNDEEHYGHRKWHPLYDNDALEAAVSAERERCAELCEALPIIGRTDQEAFGFSNGLETCAATIRRA